MEIGNTAGEAVLTPRKLVKRIICPNCWTRFLPDEIKFIARHPNLVGDPIAGENEFVRFVPMQFNVLGEALDDCGAPTSDMACPHCHLPVNDQLLEIPPLFISMIGAPAAGKSYFLTAMVWHLRRLMPQFNLEFIDSDPFANSVILDYENTLFMNPRPEIPTGIPKTQADDPRLYRMVMQKDVLIRCPSPMQFTTRLARTHSKYNENERNGRVVVLYDNAGEDYLPQTEEFVSVATQHIVRSNVYFMLYDPTQDIRFSRYCRKNGGGTLMPPQRQDSILRNAALRIRRHLGLPAQARIKTPLVVIVPKFDVCEGMGGIRLNEEPYRLNEQGQWSMDTQKVKSYSAALRDIFQELCPEFVACADELSSSVEFIPVSSLGVSPELIQEGDKKYYGIKPGMIHSKWVTVPLVYSLYKWSSGIIPPIDNETGAGPGGL